MGALFGGFEHLPPKMSVHVPAIKYKLFKL